MLCARQATGSSPVALPYTVNGMFTLDTQTNATFYFEDETLGDEKP